jgi:tetratricopeptide (TPR) repeat protein
MERALAIKEKAFGPEHPDTAAGLDNLANLLYSQGDLAGARPLLERSLTIRDKAFGPEDPNTNRARYNYARLLSDMGHAAEALAQSQAAQASHKKVLGPNHHWTKDSAGLSARLLFRHVLDSLLRPSDELLVDGSEVAAQLVEGAEVRPNTPPPQPPSTTGKPVGNEARRTRIIARSRTKKAQQNRRAAPAKRPSPDPTSNQPIASAEATCDAATDHEHPDTAASLYDFANLLHGQGDLAGAQPLYERALVIYDKVLGPEHPDTIASLNNLANLLHSQGDLEGARRLIERSLAIHDNAFGPEHPNTNRVRDNLVRLLSDMGQADEASACSQAGPASNKKVLGPDHRGSKDFAGLSTRLQRVVKGNEGHPYSPPSRSPSTTTTAKEVGIETKRAQIFARSKPEKTQQPSLDPAPNPSIAKAEAADTQRKFKEVWALYEKRGKGEA